MTDAERKLWHLLRRKQLAGFRFRRQAPIGPYIADFFCPQTKLIIELDGAPHTDEERTTATSPAQTGSKQTAAASSASGTSTSSNTPPKSPKPSTKP